MNAGDQAVERAATWLEGTAERFAGEGGLKAKLAEPLADDAQFVRKLKPSLIKARARGELPTDDEPTKPRVAPAGPQLRERPNRGAAGSPNPLVVVAAAFAAGILLAKIVDWRGHAHPRN